MVWSLLLLERMKQHFNHEILKLLLSHPYEEPIMYICNKIIFFLQFYKIPYIFFSAVKNNAFHPSIINTAYPH